VALKQKRRKTNGSKRRAGCILNVVQPYIRTSYRGLITDIWTDLLESYYEVRSEASEVVNAKIAVFCGTAPRRLGEGYRCFRGTCYLLHQVK